MRKDCLNLLEIGKAGRVARSKRWVCRGQRPRLQRCGNANSLITFFAPLKVITKNGITFETIPFRAGLVSTAEEWKYAGEIETLML
jgi:hypothetical protein